MIDILSAHRDIPEVQTAIDGLERLGAEPITLVRYSYAETPASVLDVAGTVKDALARIQLVETTVPWAVGATGVVLLVIGTVLLLVRRRPGAWRASTPPAPSNVAPEQEAEPSEHSPTLV